MDSFLKLYRWGAWVTMQCYQLGPKFGTWCWLRPKSQNGSTKVPIFPPGPKFLRKNGNFFFLNESSIFFQRRLHIRCSLTRLICSKLSWLDLNVKNHHEISWSLSFTVTKHTDSFVLTDISISQPQPPSNTHSNVGDPRDPHRVWLTAFHLRRRPASLLETCRPVTNFKPIIPTDQWAGKFRSNPISIHFSDQSGRLIWRKYELL